MVTEKITVDEDQAIETLRVVVAEVGGGFVYEPPEPYHCVYQYNGEPSCLVGRVFHRVGVPVSLLAVLDLMGNPALIDGWTVSWLHLGPVARAILVAAQQAQDAGCPAGEALKDAEQVYRESGKR